MNPGDADLGPVHQPVRVVVVDDEPGLRRVLARVLGEHGFEVTTAEDGAAGLELLLRHTYDVALVDMHMPKLGGADLLAQAKEAGVATEIIMITAFGDIDSAVSTVKAGAYDFLTKPFQSTEVVAIAVSNAAKCKLLRDRASRLEQDLEARRPLPDIVGKSSKMVEVYRIIEGVAQVNSTVLILGESGTGKELVANAIHQRSLRADKPFVVVNCAAIPAELVESELFGHVRGAFTGAQSPRTGLFEAAHGGTLFLDEIGDLPVPAQVKLLRTLESGEVKRVGADVARNVDVRVIAATNVDLREAVAAGKFRQDLFYRLNVIAVTLPPLRERPDDTIMLAYYFLDKYCRAAGGRTRRFSPDALTAIEQHSWPGNVRELMHAIEHAVVLSQDEVIGPGALPFVREARGRQALQAGRGASAANGFASLPYVEAKKRALAQFNEEYLRAALEHAEGNISEAARNAGLDRSNFRRLARKRES